MFCPNEKHPVFNQQQALLFVPNLAQNTRRDRSVLAPINFPCPSNVSSRVAWVCTGEEPGMAKPMAASDFDPKALDHRWCPFMLRPRWLPRCGVRTPKGKAATFKRLGRASSGLDSLSNLFSLFLTLCTEQRQDRFHYLLVQHVPAH